MNRKVKKPKLIFKNNNTDEFLLNIRYEIQYYVFK